MSFDIPINLSWKRGILVILIGTILAVGVLWSNALAAINLVYFIAEGGNQQVRVKWKTATELNNAGFYVQRSSQSNSGYNRINPTIIPAKGDSLSGGDYEYLDTNVINGNQYWYRLESIDFGQLSVVYTPTSVLVGVSQASTTTATGTQTASLTPSSTASPQTTVTAPLNRPGSPTVLFSPTLTSGVPYPGPGTATQPFPPVPSPTGPLPEVPAEPVLPTAPLAEVTFKPFPTVTILFPEITETALFRFNVQQAGGVINWVSTNWPRLWPLILVIALWVFLLAWFYLANRKLD